MFLISSNTKGLKMLLPTSLLSRRWRVPSWIIGRGFLWALCSLCLWTPRTHPGALRPSWGQDLDGLRTWSARCEVRSFRSWRFGTSVGRESFATLCGPSTSVGFGFGSWNERSDCAGGSWAWSRFFRAVPWWSQCKLLRKGHQISQTEKHQVASGVKAGNPHWRRGKVYAVLLRRGIVWARHDASRRRSLASDCSM